MASSSAVYAFVIRSFSRELFNRILLSTDGIYDMLARKDSFFIYGQELVNQAREYKELLLPFTVRKIDVWNEGYDDCTIALLVSDRPSRNYTNVIPSGFFSEEVLFERAMNGVEFYETSMDGADYSIHVLDESSSLLRKVTTFSSCEVLFPEKELNNFHVLDEISSSARKVTLHSCEVLFPDSKLDTDRRIFIYRIPKGFVSIQQLIEQNRHLEKRYDAEDNEEDDIYTNDFWLNTYMKLLLLDNDILNNELDLQVFYPEVMFVNADKPPKLLITSDAIKTKKRNAPSGYVHAPLTRCFEHFSIIGKLSFDTIGNLSFDSPALPLFRSMGKGQNINVNGKPFCCIVYDSDKKSFGLRNISEHMWSVEGERAREVPAGKTLRLDEEKLSFTADGKEYEVTLWLCNTQANNDRDINTRIS